MDKEMNQLLWQSLWKTIKIIGLCLVLYLVTAHLIKDISTLFNFVIN